MGGGRIGPGQVGRGAGGSGSAGGTPCLYGHALVNPEGHEPGGDPFAAGQALEKKKLAAALRAVFR